MTKKRIYSIFAMLILLAAFTACGRSTQEEHPTIPSEYLPVPPSEPVIPIESGNNRFRGLNGASDGFVTDFDFGESQFPAVHITTAYHIIDRHVRIPGSISVNNVDEAFQLADTPMRIHGRGNSSWNYMDKKPFRIRFSEPIAMLDAGHAARDWTFIPNHSDKALMRNYSAYYMASLLNGMSYAPFARFVDVYFNGEYQGVYMLCVQLNEISEGRIHLTYDADPALSEYLIELNRRVHYDPQNIEGLHFLRMHGHGRYYHIRWPTEDRPNENALTTAHANYLRDFLDQIDRLIYRRDVAVFNYICKASFVDFYIVQEIYKNYDISSLSVWMQIRGQGNERRLEKGPVWDFDIAAGNCYYQDRNNHRGGYGPTGIWAGYMNRWFRYLLQMPEFRTAVAQRLDYVNENALPQTIARINHMATQYQPSFERNFVRWPIMGVYIWPNPQSVVEIDTFMGQVDYLTDFLQSRTAWLIAYFNR